MCDPELVIAVIESKKTLYSKDLTDGYQEIRSVDDVHKVRPMALAGFDQAYRDIVGQAPPNPGDIAKEPLALQMVYCALVAEHNLPLRVILGYDGFASEKNFRESFVGFLEKNIGARGFGPVNFPNLMISGDYSLVKLSGQPYAARMEGMSWHCLASTKYNPTQLLLEHLWDRLQYHHPLPQDIWGDGLSYARVTPLIKAVCIQEGEKVGWDYTSLNISDADLKMIPAEEDWSPTFVGFAAYTVFSQLMKKDVDTSHPAFRQLCESHGYSVGELIAELIQTGLVACDGLKLYPLTTVGRAGTLPDGRYFIGDDVDGDLTTWLIHFAEEWKRRPKSIELQ